MPQVDLLVHNASQLITCASGGKPKRGAEMRDVGIIENGAVAIVDGKFIAVGPTDEILSHFSAKEVIDAGGRAVCPGFVDPHTHIVFAGDRLNEFELRIQGAEYLDILAAGGGIISTVRNTRAASQVQLVEESRKRLDKMLACGTTTAEVKTGYGLDTETELKMLRVIEELDETHPIDLVPTLLAAHAVPPEFQGNIEGYIDLICEEILPKALDWYYASTFPVKGVPFFADAFCEKNAFDWKRTDRILGTADILAYRVKAHVDQFTNIGGSRLGISLGAVSIDHLDVISDEEIVMLVNSDTVGIVIPTENFSAGKMNFANARKMIDAGCAIALSTDYNPGSAPCPSMSMAMAISCRYQKLLPSEAICAATINAAFGIGLGTTHGSIEIGKSADFLILDSNDYRQLAYEFGGNLVSTVIKKGLQVSG